MKIYSSRSIESVINSVIGKDLWISAYYNGKGPSYFQILRHDNSSPYYSFYMCRELSSRWVNNLFSGICNWNEDAIKEIAENVYDFADWGDSLNNYGFKVATPIEILTDKEIFGEWADIFKLLKEPKDSQYRKYMG